MTTDGRKAAEEAEEAEATAAEFDELMADVMASAGRFGHREHVRLTWSAVRRFGTGAAVGLVGAGIRRTARYAGAPQKYHATVSRAWVELVGHHVEQDGDGDGEGDFDGFVERNPALLDKALLMRFYRSATLAGPAARSGWVEPDVAPFPWCVPSADAATGSRAAAPPNPPPDRLRG